MSTQSDTFTRRANDEALDLIFRDARSFSNWIDRPVHDDLLRGIYELMKLGPTSANSCPARIVFLRTPKEKERLLPALSPTNVDKTRAAPVTAIVAHDLQFYERIPYLFPHAPNYRDVFATTPDLAATTAFRNGSLQGAYFIIAARSLGLDCGPMSGFDNAKVDEEFFSKPAPGFFEKGRLKSNFLCNLGYGDRSKLHARSPRLSFEEACVML